jgi:uncharacterized protein
MRELAITLGIGFVSGVLSGAFGIGGGVITTPAIRLILGAPALIAVGTPLPVIFPSALTGAISYSRAGVADKRAGIVCGIAGSATAVLGAWATSLVGGNIVLLATAALILYTAADMVLQVVRPPRLGLEAGEEADAFGPHDGVGNLGADEGSGARRGNEGQGALEASEDEGERTGFAPEGDSWPRSERAKPVSEAAPNRLAPTPRLILIGILTGFYSGFLGLGGGFILVPMLTRWLGFDIKRAIATSLVAISILVVPATVQHALLGHIDWRIAAVLAVGVIPGALLGSRFTIGSADRTVRLAFAVMLLLTGAWLAFKTLTGGLA